MTANLGLVAHAAERHAHELAAKRIGNGLGERRLADPGEAEKQRIGPFTSGFSLRTARYSRTRSFTFSRPEWSASSTSLVRLRSIESSVRFAQGSAMIQSRYVRETEYSAAATGILRAGRALASLPSDRLGQPGGVDLCPQLVDPLACSSPSPSSFDRLHLLAQEILPLVLAHFRLHLRLDLRSELEDLELLDEQTIERVHPGADIQRLEYFLLDRGSDGRQARGVKSASLPKSVMLPASA